jgi:hypothetical protein
MTKRWDEMKEERYTRMPKYSARGKGADGRFAALQNLHIWTRGHKTVRCRGSTERCPNSLMGVGECDMGSSGGVMVHLTFQGVA